MKTIKRLVLEKDIKRAERLAFTRGYICAVGTMLSCPHTEVAAEEALRAFGRVRRRDIDDFDIKAIEGAGLGRFLT